MKRNKVINTIKIKIYDLEKKIKEHQELEDYMNTSYVIKCRSRVVAFKEVISVLEKDK